MKPSLSLIRVYKPSTHTANFQIPQHYRLSQTPISYYQSAVSVNASHENSSPEEHTLYVWDHFISKSLAKNVFIVAHSYGGLSYVNLALFTSLSGREGRRKNEKLQNYSSVKACRHVGITSDPERKEKNILIEGQSTC
ncbi:hypothetical protein PO909_025622 [Leuciscus waleckii]